MQATKTDTSTELATDTFPDSLKAREQWLITRGDDKSPISPCTGHGKGWTESEKQVSFQVAKDEAEQRGGSELGFVFTDNDPFVFIDFDDVRNPDTGRIGPEVQKWIEQADSYTDVSSSGAGIHIIVKARLPDNSPAITGSIPDSGKVEVYEKERFCIMTGKHLSSTPATINKNQELISSLSEEFATKSSSTPKEAIQSPSLSREKVEGLEKTSNPDDIWDAVKHTRPSDITFRSKITEERSDGTKSRDPSWANSKSGTRLGQFEDGFVYRDGMIGLDVLQVIALEEGIITDPNEYPSDEQFWKAVDELRQRGAQIPEYVPPNSKELYLSAPTNVTQYPLDEARKSEHADGRDWTTTEELRDKLSEVLRERLQSSEPTIIEAPTAAGKTHTVATTPWASYPDVTGDAPVIHLSKTRKARDDAHNKSQEYGIESVRLRANEELCSVARGVHDHNDALNELVPSDQPISKWLKDQTHKKGIPFARAHKWINDESQRKLGKPLPCCKNGECESESQWSKINSNKKQPDIIHATHLFAHQRQLIEDSNVIFDERPEFKLDEDSDTIKNAVEAYLQEVDAACKSWEEFVTLALRDGSILKRHNLRKSVEGTPADEWFLTNPDAHICAPAITEAIANAHDAGNMRHVGKATFEPHYRQGNERKAPDRIELVLTDRYEFNLVKWIPPLGAARSVIGMDAHPSKEQWELNTRRSMSVVRLLDPEERRLWRRYERGLLVFQIGDAVRPYTSSDWFAESKAQSLIDRLTDDIPALRTAVTSKAVEPQVNSMLPDSEATPAVLHYGEEHSRNDFIDESAGLLLGCIDPGDSAILDWLALLDKDASPVRTDDSCDECGGSGCPSCLGTGHERAHGREFEGPDADVAERLLASVREAHVAQAIGRYARRANRPATPTVVYVWTAAIPDKLVDMKLPDIKPLTDIQRQIVQCLSNASESLSARDIASKVDVCKETVRQTLSQLQDSGYVSVKEGAGDYGAHLYHLWSEPSGLFPSDTSG